MARTVIARVAAAGVAVTIMSLATVGPAAAPPAFACCALAAAGGDYGSSLGGATSPPAHPGWVKYYIVPPPAGEATQSLTQLALATLGSGSFAGQILKDNLGRIQPDGGRLTSSGALRPGWILVLPAAAQGPGVIYGPLPVASTAPTSAKHVTPARRARANARAAGPSGRPARAGNSWAMLAGAAFAAAVAAIVLGMGAAALLRRRRRLTQTGEALPRPEAGTLAPHGSPIPARELAAAGAAGPGWIEPAPESWDDNDDVPPGHPAPAGGTEPARKRSDSARDARAPGALGRFSRGTPEHNEGGGSRQQRRTDQSRFHGRHRRRQDARVSPDAQHSSGPEETPELPNELEPLAEFPGLDDPDSTDDEESSYLSWLSTISAKADPPDGPEASDAPEPGAAETPIAPPEPAAPANADTVGPADQPAAAKPDARGLGESGPGAAPPSSDPWDRTPEIPAADNRPPQREEEEQEPEPRFSPAALHLLGASLRSHGGDGTGGPAQHHRVVLGDNRVDVVLAQGPAAGPGGKPRDGKPRDGKVRDGKAWLASSPYLAWAPLPYEPPEGGAGFACLGAGDEGCLFIDLAAAPGVITITGSSDSAAQLAESLAHQLCRQAADGGSCTVVLVGDVVPEPHPQPTVLVRSLRELGLANDATAPETEIVFCALRGSEDVFVLARHVSRSAHRVVPVVLADIPGAPWSFCVTAQPALDKSSA